MTRPSGTADAALAALHAAGWTRAANAADAPDGLVARAPALRTFSGLHSPDDAVWFLPDPDAAFAWDEFSTMSLDAAVTDDDRRAVIRFWDAHTPFLHSVRHGYEYLAVREDGAVVHGAEPEFEDATVVAPTIEALLAAIVAGEYGSVTGRLFG